MKNVLLSRVSVSLLSLISGNANHDDDGNDDDGDDDDDDMIMMMVMIW